MTAGLSEKKKANELSTDINTITAEINAYQRIAGEAIFEIGRRLKHVKENDLAHGEWSKWLEAINMTQDTARRFVRVYEEFGESKHVTSRDLGINALYELVQIPPEQRDRPHVTAKGEEKKPEEMTVRELRELKRQLRAEQAERERLEKENEELANRPPEVEVITEYIEEEPQSDEPYNRMMDKPYTVERGNDFYMLMKDVDELYRKYAHLKDGIEELRGIAAYDDDLKLKYRKADEFWRMLNGIFNERNNDIIDVEII